MRKRERSCLPMWVPCGSSFLMARKAVGAVKSALTPCWEMTPPEGARVGRADRLALVEDRGAALQERRVDDVRVPDDPADVGRGPVRLARAHAVDVLHGPLERHRVAAVVAHDALGDARRPGGVEDVERVGRRHRHALGGGRAGEEIAPVEVAPLRGAAPSPAGAGGPRSARACGWTARWPCRGAACRARPARPRCRRRPRGSSSAWRRRCAWPARGRRSRRRPRSGWRRCGRRPAWR